MRSITCLVSLLLLLPAAAANAADATGKLTDTEKTELLSMLDSTAKDFLALIDGVSEEQWKWKSSPDRWSVGECAEHVILSERMLYQTALDALKSPADPEWATKTDGKVDFLKKVMPNRNPGGAGGAKAPQEIVPTGSLTRDEVVRRFNESRTEIRALRRRARPAGEGAHRGASVPGVRSAQRLRLVDLRAAPHHPAQPADRRGAADRRLSREVAAPPRR